MFNIGCKLPDTTLVNAWHQVHRHIAAIVQHFFFVANTLESINWHKVICLEYADLWMTQGYLFRI